MSNKKEGSNFVSQYDDETIIMSLAYCYLQTKKDGKNSLSPEVQQYFESYIQQNPEVQICLAAVIAKKSEAEMNAFFKRKGIPVQKRDVVFKEALTYKITPSPAGVVVVHDFDEAMHKRARSSLNQNKFLSFQARAGMESKQEAQALYQRARAEGWPPSYVKFSRDAHGRTKFSIVDTPESRRFLSMHLSQDGRSVRPLYRIKSEKPHLMNAGAASIPEHKRVFIGHTYGDQAQKVVDVLYDRLVADGFPKNKIYKVLPINKDPSTARLVVENIPGLENYLDRHIYPDGRLRPTAIEVQSKHDFELRQEALKKKDVLTISSDKYPKLTPEIAEGLAKRAQACGYDREHVHIHNKNGVVSVQIAHAETAQQFVAANLNKDGSLKPWQGVVDFAQRPSSKRTASVKRTSKKAGVDDFDLLTISRETHPHLTDDDMVELAKRAVASGWQENEFYLNREPGRHSIEFFRNGVDEQKFIRTNIGEDGKLKPLPQAASSYEYAEQVVRRNRAKVTNTDYSDALFHRMEYKNGSYVMKKINGQDRELGIAKIFFMEHGIDVDEQRGNLVINDEKSVEKMTRLIEQNRRDVQMILEGVSPEVEYVKINRNTHPDVLDYVKKSNIDGAFVERDYVYVEKQALKNTPYASLADSSEVKLHKITPETEEIFHMVDDRYGQGRVHTLKNGEILYEKAPHLERLMHEYQTGGISLPPRTKDGTPIPQPAVREPIPVDLETAQSRRRLGQSYKLRGDIGYVRGGIEDWHKLKELGIDCRMYKGSYVLFEEAKAKAVLKNVGALTEPANFDNLLHIKLQKAPANILSYQKALREQGIPTQTVVREVDGKKELYVAYSHNPESAQKVKNVTREFSITTLDNNLILERKAKEAGIHNKADYCYFDSPEDAIRFEKNMKKMGVKCTNYAGNTVIFEQEAAVRAISNLGLKPEEMSKMASMQVETNLKQGEAYYLRQELRRRDVYAGLHQTKNGDYVVAYDRTNKKAISCAYDIKHYAPGELFADEKERARAKPRSDGKSYKDGMRDFISTHRVSDEVPEGRITRAKRKVGEFVDAAAHTGRTAIQKVQEVQTKVKTAARTRIASVKGGQQALKVLSAASKGAKALGPVVAVGMAGIDPKGTAEFVGDIANLRLVKVATETLEGISYLATSPFEAAGGMYDAASNAVAEHYDGAKTKTDYVLRTATGIGKGVLNVGDAVWMSLGQVRGALNENFMNFKYELIGSSTRVIEGQHSPEAYKKDTLEFLSDLISPDTVNIETGLRTDDTVYSVIDRNNPKTMAAFIQERGVNSLAVSKNKTPYTTALAYAIAEDKMLAAFEIYKCEKARSFQKEGRDAITKTSVAALLLHRAALKPEEINKGKRDTSNYSKDELKSCFIAEKMLCNMLDNDEVYIYDTDQNGDTLFMEAASCGHIGFVAKLAKKDRSLVNKKNKFNQNALHLSTDNQLMVATLIQLGVAVNEPDKRGQTPLMIALKRNKNNNSIAMLLDATDESGLKALAASPEHVERLNKWLSDKPEIRVAILSAENHPLKDMVANLYPEEGKNFGVTPKTELTKKEGEQENPEQQTPDQKSPDLNGALTVNSDGKVPSDTDDKTLPKQKTTDSERC